MALEPSWCGTRPRDGGRSSRRKISNHHILSELRAAPAYARIRHLPARRGWFLSSQDCRSPHLKSAGSLGTAPGSSSSAGADARGDASLETCMAKRSTGVILVVLLAAVFISRSAALGTWIPK